MKTYYVYIMASRTKKFYTGMTNNLERRVFEHKNKIVPGFASFYEMTKLVFYEEANDVTAVIQREKEIKGWLRKKKISLIEAENPDWDDLAIDWF